MNTLFRTDLYLPALAFALVVGNTTMAQVPTKCLEIESILVDACNPPPCSADEGPSEMFRFRTGPASIAFNEISVAWPNASNPWRGLVQNATTASITAYFNATITNCGLLLEPPGGIIPPGSPVIMVTSTDVCLAGNSFAELTDTLYIVYQAAGNTSGHFANGTANLPISPTPPNGNNIRTLVVTYIPTNCRDTAAYVRERLVNEYGTYGGSEDERNGSTVEFSWPGVPVASYVNHGCQAPFSPLVVEATATGMLCGSTSSVALVGQVTGGSFTSVEWSGGTGTFGDPAALTTTYTAGAGDQGTVTLSLCVQAGCADPICDNVVVSAGSSPTMTIQANGPTTVCPGDELVLTASGADSYAWSSGQNTAAITVSTPGTYTVTGTNVCGTGQASVEVVQGAGPTVTISGNPSLCPGGTTTLTAGGASSYVWSTGASGATITVSTEGPISVTGTGTCGTGTASMTVTAALALSMTHDDVTCHGDTDGRATVTASGGSGTYTYTWSPAGGTGAVATDLAPGGYLCEVDDGAGCSAQVQVTIEEPPPVVVVAMADVPICIGQSVTLTATTTGEVGAVTSTWTPEGPLVMPTTTTTYSVQATDVNGCTSAPDEVIVSVTDAFVPDFTWDTDEGCAPHCVTFTDVSSVAGMRAWSFSDGGSAGDQAQAVHCFTQAGTYGASLTITTVDGCSGTFDQVDIITAFPSPSARFTASPLVTMIDDPVFRFTSVVPGITTWNWSFGDPLSSTSDEPEASFSYPDIGCYTVTLEVTNEGGCTASEDAMVCVEDMFALYVPNSFTPDGDGINDVFIPTTTVQDADPYTLSIFDRWGRELYVTNNLRQGWDGSGLPTGVYAWMVSLTDPEGQTRRHQGHVTLLR